MWNNEYSQLFLFNYFNKTNWILNQKILQQHILLQLFFQYDNIFQYLFQHNHLFQYLFQHDSLHFHGWQGLIRMLHLTLYWNENATYLLISKFHQSYVMWRLRCLKSLENLLFGQQLVLAITKKYQILALLAHFKGSIHWWPLHSPHLFTDCCFCLSVESIVHLPLHWRHNEHDGISNQQPYDCLLNRLFMRRSKETSNLCVTGLCAGSSPVTGEFPAQMASNAENVSIWWRLHARLICDAITLVWRHCNEQQLLHNIQ